MIYLKRNIWLTTFGIFITAAILFGGFQILKAEGPPYYCPEPESYSYNNDCVTPSDFLNQFVGKKRVDIQDLTYNIHNITGATYSAEAIIELVDYVLNIIHGSLIKKT